MSAAYLTAREAATLARLNDCRDNPREDIRNMMVADPLATCGVCACEAAGLTPWACRGALVVLVGHEHHGCAQRAREAGYERCPGAPGMFPGVCGGCRWRRNWYCANPLQARLGGAGLVAKRASNGLDVVSCSGRRPA